MLCVYRIGGDLEPYKLFKLVRNEYTYISMSGIKCVLHKHAAAVVHITDRA